MASVISEFFLINDINLLPPDTLAELVPYLLEIVVGVALVSGMFGVIGKLVDLLLDFTRWR